MGGPDLDGQRFDAMARAMANGATRRRALRLAGGGLAGALLAAVGLGRRAGAQDGPPCGELRARCFERGEATCGPEPTNSNTPAHLAWHDCIFAVPVCQSYLQTCNGSCALMGGCGQTGCPQGGVCATAVNPGNQIVCRCVSLD